MINFLILVLNNRIDNWRDDTDVYCIITLGLTAHCTPVGLCHRGLCLKEGGLTRASFFYDGFNLYHSIEKLPKKYRWLNLKKLSECFITKQEQLSQIYYFSALAFWNTEKVRRHERYIKALESVGVIPVLGKFKKIQRHCTICHQKYPAHEEKQTDVNIAIQLLKSAFLDSFDIAYIVSGDSDLIPSIQSVKAQFPDKKIYLVVPIKRSANELENVCDKTMRLKMHHLDTSMFPREVKHGDSLVSCCPDEWM